MKSLPGTHMNQRGMHAFVPVRADIMLSNVLGAAAAEARYTADEPDFNIAKYVNEMLATSMMSPRDYMRAMYKPGGSDQQLDQSGAELWLAYEFKTNELQRMPPWATQLLGSLQARRISVLDYGPCLLNRLLSQAGSRRGLSITPASGWPRQHVLHTELASSMSVIQPGHETSVMDRNNKQRKLMRAYSLPSPGSNYVQVLARMLAEFDKHRLNFDAFRPEVGKKLAGGPGADRLWGPAFSMIDMVQRLGVPAILWMISAVKFHYMIGAGVRAISKPFYANRATSKTGLAQVEEQEARMDQLPIHPLLEYVGSAFMQTCKLLCPEGDAETRLIPLATSADIIEFGGENYLPEWTEDPCSSSAEISKLEDGYREYVLDSVTGFETDPCRSAGWGWSAQSDPDWISIHRFVSAIFEDSEMLPLLNSMAKDHLGWQSMKSELSDFDARGSDWAITDGIACSKSPHHVLLGLSPALSLGNKKKLGIGVRMDQFFLEADRMQPVYTITVHGDVEPLTTGSALEKTYIPWGMVMGEPGTVHLGASADVIGAFPRHLIAFYGRKPTDRYLRYGYSDIDPLILAASDDWKSRGVRQSSWDPYATNFIGDNDVLAGPGFAPVPDIADWLTTWMADIAPQSDPALKTDFAVRPDSSFYMRVNVIMSRADGYFLVSRLGHVRGGLRPFEHAILFDNDLVLSRDMKELDVLLTLMPRNEQPAAALVADIDGAPL